MYKFLQRHFFTGLLSITPLAITVGILYWVYGQIASRMRPWLAKIPGVTETYPDFVLTVMGVVVFFLLITLVGLFTRNLIGIAFFRLLERFFERIPVVKSVFSAVKQIAEVFLKDRRTAFQKAVLFAYPRQGLYSIGFVTRDEPGEPLVNVFLPTTPNPTSGYLLLVPREDLAELPIPIEDAIKLIVSGGSIMTPEQATQVKAHTDKLNRGPSLAEPDTAPRKDLEP